MNSNAASRLGIGIIGAGKVGAVLGSALRATGHAVIGASAVSEASRERAEMLLPEVPILEIPEIVERAELVVLAVPDDALEELVSGLARLNSFQTGQLLVHTSGRYGIGILEPATRAGAIGLAIHPAMTFTGTSLDLKRLAGCPFAVTAQPAFLPIAQALAVEMGGEPRVVAEADRPAYHAALSHGANHLVVLVSQARELLEQLGVEDPGEMLRPLLGAALDESLARGDSALTGPVSRGDVGTVHSHLLALGELAQRAAPAADGSAADLEGVLRTYRALARAAVGRSVGRGSLDEADAAGMLEILDDARGSGQAQAEGGS